MQTQQSNLGSRLAVMVAAAVMAGGATLGAFAGNPVPGTKPASLDADGDGSVSAAEITAAATEWIADAQAKFLEKYDTLPTGQTAGDGIVTLAESTAVFEARAADWLEHVLAVYDANDDGGISAEEAAVTGRRARGHHHLDTYDTDDDGALSAGELQAAAGDQAADQLERFLARYDSVPTGQTAGDGIITVAESLAVHTAMVEERVDAFLERFDTNRDGAVSEDELGTPKHGRVKGGAPGRGGRR